MTSRTFPQSPTRPAAPSPPNSPAGRVLPVALGALAAETAAGYLLLGGQPNPGMAAAALLPLAVAAGAWAGKRWAPIAALLVVLTLVALRQIELSFDLLRPGDPVPFVAALLVLATAGVTVSSAAVHLKARIGAPRTTSVAAVLMGGGALALTAGLALVVVLPQGDSTGSLTQAQVDALPTVGMVDFKFEPAQLRVSPGEQVAFRFTNTSGGTHAFTVDDLAVDVQVPSGRSRTIVVDAPAGTYDYYCSVGSHHDEGMKGRLVVADPVAPAGGSVPTGPDSATSTMTSHNHG